MGREKIEFYIRFDNQQYFYDFDTVSDYNIHDICPQYYIDSFILESSLIVDDSVKQSIMVRITPKDKDVTILDAVKRYIKRYIKDDRFFIDEMAEEHYTYFLKKYDKEDVKKLVNSDKK